MSRYGRAVYGTAKYGLDLWSQYSVEPMVASITVDPVAFVQTSSFTDGLGNAVYDRVQVSWLPTSIVDEFVLLRSNLGYPTSPSDPFSKVLLQQYEISGVTEVVDGGGTTKTVTYTTTINHSIKVGESVTTSGINPDSMNVTATVTAVTSTTFSVDIPGSTADTYASGGTVTHIGSTTLVQSLTGDPSNRLRTAILDSNVLPGREYFYAIWVYLNSSAEWILAGRAMTTTSNDHGTLDSLKDALPPYTWGRYSGPGDGTSVLADDDDEDDLTRWLQSCAWELDQSLTKVDLLESVWDPQYTPAVLLDEAVSMFGLPVEPALGERAQRSLLTNAATITADRGTVTSISRLIESLTGFSCPPIPPNTQGYNNKGGISFGSNLICNTDESSFEGLEVASGSVNVISGTGRWYFTNGSLVRIGGDTSNSGVNIARDLNTDDTVSAGARYGIHIDAVSTSSDISMSLGERVRISNYNPGTGYADVTTAWDHGLVDGDTVNISLDGGTTNYSVIVQYALDDLNVRILTVAGMPTVASSPTDGFFSGGMIPAYQGIPIEPSVSYALVGKFMSNSSQAQNINLTMNYYDRFGNSLGNVQVTPATMSPVVTIPVESSGGWTQIYVAGTSPANAASATLVITLPQSGATQYLDVDSLMVKSGGTPYNDPSLAYSNSTQYQGSVDYTYEDARLMTITIDTTTTSASASTGNVPVTIQQDLMTVIQSRLIDILDVYIPVGTAFQVVLI